MKGNKKSKSQKFSLLGANAAGIKQKFNSLVTLVDELKPSCITLQETKLKRKGWLKFEVIRSLKASVMSLVEEDLLQLSLRNLILYLCLREMMNVKCWLLRLI